MEIDFAIDALAALAQKTRLSIFRLLIQTGPEGLSVGEISENVGATGATLSHHLSHLTHAGLINARQEGRFIYYAANFTIMDDLLSFLTANCCAGKQECRPKTKRRSCN